jgi:stearoyl-CoA desaturase (delta-9 desaturase)
MSHAAADAPTTKRALRDGPPPKRGGIDWSNLNWTVIIGIGAMHVIALFAVFPALFSWSGLGLFVLFFWVSGGLGITLCFHRLLTHHSFRTPKWFKYFLTSCGCLAWQGGPITWVGTHRLHHQHSDSDHDPHSPTHGFTWSHILWTLHRKLEGIHAWDAAKDLQKDEGIVFLDKYFWLPQAVLAAALFGVGFWIGGVWLGLSWVVWAVAFRTIAVYHTTWFVNSASHTWGYKNYETTGEQSTNLWWVALLSWGEGWHNNHHAHPRSAAHGLRWFEIDPTYWTIKLLSWVGLAKSVHTLPPEKMPAAQKPGEQVKPGELGEPEAIRQIILPHAQGQA